MLETVPGLFRTPTHNFGLFHQSDIDLTPRLTATLELRYDVSQAAIYYATLGAVWLARRSTSSSGGNPLQVGADVRLHF